MPTHKFSRSGYDDIEFDLQIQDYTMLNDIITAKVPTVGTRQEPLTTSETKMTITGVLVLDGSKSSEQKAYELVAMAKFGALINLQIETDIIRTWEGLSEGLNFRVLAARTNELQFVMKFKVDDYP